MGPYIKVYTLRKVKMLGSITVEISHRQPLELAHPRVLQVLISERMSSNCVPVLLYFSNQSIFPLPIFGVVSCFLLYYLLNDEKCILPFSIFFIFFIENILFWRSLR